MTRATAQTQAQALAPGTLAPGLEPPVATPAQAPALARGQATATPQALATTATAPQLA